MFNSPSKCNHIESQTKAPQTSNNSNLKIPTFKELIDAYNIVTEFTRKKLNKPSIEKMRNNILGATRIIDGTGHDRNELYTNLTTKEIDEWAYRMSDSEELCNTSIKSYMESLRALTAQYLRFEYEKLGYKVESIKLPAFDGSANRYRRPPDELLQKVKDYYAKLRTDDIELWMFVTLMLGFAVRTSDALNMRWDNIIKKNGSNMLCYTPNKTKFSSKRIVCWPITDDIMNGIAEYKVWWLKNRKSSKKFDPQKIFCLITKIKERVNSDMRKLGFQTTKACYELRKICIDHVYEKFGSEMASSISGDNIDTILHYYADPGALNKVINCTTLL